MKKTAASTRKRTKKITVPFSMGPIRSKMRFQLSSLSTSQLPLLDKPQHKPFRSADDPKIVSPAKLCKAICYMEKILAIGDAPVCVRGKLKFAVIVEKDESGYYVASVPELPGCHTQGKTLDELTRRIKQAIEAYLEAEGFRPKEGVELVGLQFVEVSTS